MDLLAALASFIRVAETGSFSAVSREAGISQPTVSRHVALLEQHFEVRLFNRTTRSFTVTQDGRSLLTYAHQIADALEQAEAAVGRRQAVPKGMVRLGTTTAFGLYLSGRIGLLLNRYPDLELDLVMHDSFGDMVEEGLDLTVRIGQPSEGSLITRHLWDVERILVAAPAYLHRRKIPSEPNDLLDHLCIAYTYGTALREWEFKREDAIRVISANGRFHANNSEVVHKAALAAMGIALLPIYQVEANLMTGQLVRLMPDWHAPRLPLYLIYPGARTLPLRTRTVLDFLAQLPKSDGWS